MRCGGVFDERRPGLDHLGLAVTDLDTLEAWRDELDEHRSAPLRGGRHGTRAGTSTCGPRATSQIGVRVSEAFAGSIGLDPDEPAVAGGSLSREVAGQLGPRPQATLAQHRAQVVLDGLGAQEESGGRLAVGQTLGDQQGDPGLLGGEGRSAAPSRDRSRSPVAASSVVARSCHGGVVDGREVGRGGPELLAGGHPPTGRPEPHPPQQALSPTGFGAVAEEATVTATRVGERRVRVVRVADQPPAAGGHGHQRADIPFPALASR